MHNLAVALHLKGDIVSGSDDAIFEPSRSKLLKYGLLPSTEGWNPSLITPELDAVILGMHAREDNPELIRARELGLKIYSFPEFLYEQFREKTRVVIAGSHGKTTITAMVLHALQKAGKDPDYMVGARLKGFEVMVKITAGPGITVLEGDEYLTSPIDRRPKFIHYRPHIALVSGIAWDHINVFPTEDLYFKQFEGLLECMEDGAELVYCASDPAVVNLSKKTRKGMGAIPYAAYPAFVRDGQTVIQAGDGEFPIQVFGQHNLENIAGAGQICRLLGMTEMEFLSAMESFPGADRRLEKLAEKSDSLLFRDFAHAPSKLRATVKAAREQFPERKLIACFELHTFSSLNREYLNHYKNCLDPADDAAVFFHPDTFHHKRIEPYSDEEVREAFNRQDLQLIHDPGQLLAWLRGLSLEHSNILLMSSGDFHGLDLVELIAALGYERI
jgi:UDP-N-acetylmuramate: L-alanyl-gamma-D-glutamyl-meso-diaminopimelate ligase